MHIIPVIDLLDGQAVQAIRGERKHYQPVKSILVPNGSSRPVEIANALVEFTSCQAIYVADLNAIQGTGDNTSDISALVKQLGCEIWLDAGISSPVIAEDFVRKGIDRVIVGSETLSSLDALEMVRDAIPSQNRVFSLDTFQGKILSSSNILQNQSPLATLSVLAGDNWSHIILLSLDRVGTGASPDWELLSRVRKAFPDINLVAGGGVRRLDDLCRLAEIGVDGVLIASALHYGWISKSELQDFTID